MRRSDAGRLNRRDFLKQTGLVAGGLLAGCKSQPSTITGEKSGGRVAIAYDPADPVPAAPPAQWAMGQLRQALESRGFAIRICQRIEQAAAGETCIVAAGAGSRATRQITADGKVSMPDAPESLVLISGKLGDREVLLAAGSDARGLSYALTELADSVGLADDPGDVLVRRPPVVERPANSVRSIMRIFVSDVEDKGWFQDKAFWPPYLDMLAGQRFNRFNLSFGIGYDFAQQLLDTYFYFAYPFLLAVPGYNVRAVGLPDAERDLNLRMLKYISEEAARRGLHFQLGLWTHAYKWSNSPNVNYVIEGLTPEQHGPYCRDALSLLLRECPAIAGVNFRVHGESGVTEGSYQFWKTVFDGVVAADRKIEIDMHAKGMNQTMIDTALATGMPVTISPKFWAEHMGLPYHQANIRELEKPRPNRGGLMSLSAGSRNFLRYGYGDLLTENRPYSVLHRIWPGTQRLLLWGDPTYAAAYSRAMSFCGSVGAEIFEPLSFKGRKGSGLPGGRDGYADRSLKTAGGDWRKYLYTYRLWGRLLYDPATSPEVWRRQLRRDYGPAAEPVESALGKASRILPLVTTAHDPSAANNGYWPEIYLNMSIVDASRPGPYGDTPSPKRFGTVSPLDPQLFATCDEFADGLIQGPLTGKYSPIEVAQQLEDWVLGSLGNLVKAKERAEDSRAASLRRMAMDVDIACGLGLFFAEKLRAAVLYALYERTGQDAALQEALKAYRAARQAWAASAGRADGVYVRDITFGLEPQLRGHWLDRLEAIDKDIVAMEGQAGRAPVRNVDLQAVAKAIRTVLARPQRPAARVEHTPPASFKPGQDVPIQLQLLDSDAASVTLLYRRLNQAETYRSKPMVSVAQPPSAGATAEGSGATYEATIEGDYGNSPFPLEYYFELRTADGRAWLYPGFAQDFVGQPYFVVRQA
jgi:hypothetical protein